MNSKVKVNMKTLTPQLLNKMHAYWRAANFLSVGQMYLRDNPLLRKPLELAHVKRMLLGHWGTTPGQNFIYVHLNRIIKEHDLDMIYISGPGHGGPAVVANATSKVPTARSIQTSVRMSPDSGNCLRSFRSQAAFPAMPRLNVRDRFMRVANWDIRSATHLALHSIIPN